MIRKMSTGARVRFAVMATVVAGCAVAAIVIVKHKPPPPLPKRRPIAQAPYAHPVLPSKPAVNPTPMFCEARDVNKVALALRQAQRKLIGFVDRAPASGAPPACRTTPETRSFLSEHDVLMRRISFCVARDTALDTQWDQVQSAAVAFDACIDCTRPRAGRWSSCSRVLQLLDEAQRATP